MSKTKQGIKNVFHSSESGVYRVLETLCARSVPSEGKKRLDKDSHKFDEAFATLESEIKLFQKKIDSIVLVSLVAKWAHAILTDVIYGERYVRLMCDLIEADLVQLDRSKNQPHTIGTFSDHQHIITEIRNYESWSILRREEYVCFYIEFSNWLAEVTFGYVPAAQDHDRQLSVRRKIPFDAYIRLLDALNLRERIIVKFYYLGGERSLEEILSLEIKAIDFKKHRVLFADRSVEYPEHLFSDMHKFLEGRTNGYLFSNREGEKINHTVPYRALKTVAEKLNFGSSFTFKDLVAES